MELSLADILTVGGAAILVTILVQAFKRYMPEENVPQIALAIGVVVVVAAALALGQRSTQQLAQAVLTGVLAGAAAIGLYEAQAGRLLGPKG